MGGKRFSGYIGLVIILDFLSVSFNLKPLADLMQTQQQPALPKPDSKQISSPPTVQDGKFKVRLGLGSKTFIGKILVFFT